MSDVDGTVDDGAEFVTDESQEVADLLEEDVLLLADAEPELVLPVWEPTGDAAVDAALEELAALDELAPADHVEVFSSVHRALHSRLVDLES